LPGLPVSEIARPQHRHRDRCALPQYGSTEDNDMQLCLATMFDPEQMRGFMPDPVAMFMVGAVLMRPHSTGRLSLASSDPMVAPRIELNYLDDPRDIARMLEAWRIGRDSVPH
jgi:choline dehydrogenase-like flavoprotein